MLLAWKPSSAESFIKGTAGRRKQLQIPDQYGCLRMSIANSHPCKIKPNLLSARTSATHLNPTVSGGKGVKKENYSRHSGHGVPNGTSLGARQRYQNEDWHTRETKAEFFWSALPKVFLLSFIS